MCFHVTKPSTTCKDRVWQRHNAAPQLEIPYFQYILSQPTMRVTDTPELPAAAVNRSRAATYDYFHNQLIYRLFSQLINRLFHDMSKKCEKCSTHFPRAQCDLFNSLLLSNPKTQGLLIYYHK